MSQKTLTSFFNSRKRPAVDEAVSSKNKIAHIERNFDGNIKYERRDKPKVLDLNCQEDKLSPIVLAAKFQLKQGDGKKNGRCQTSPSKSQTPERSINTVFDNKVNSSNVTKVTELSKSEILSSARKELSLGDIKKRLAGSSRLAELKASAERISKGIATLQKTSEKRNLKEFKSLDVEVPISPNKKKPLSHDNSPSQIQDNSANNEKINLISPRKVIISPIKSPSKLPAYIKHAALATSSSLPLPHQYRLLAELFRGMETVVSLLYNRNEKITFSKLKPSIQEMLKRNFTEKHLGQIKHLVPDYYNFEIQKIKNFTSTAQKDAYELVISPNIPTDIKTMNPSVLLERRRFFYDILINMVKKNHAQFLSTLDPPLDIPDEKLVRWHPEFNLERVAEIECASLPEMPNVDKYSSAQDVLARARELFKCNNKMEKALSNLTQAKTLQVTESIPNAVNASKVNVAVQTQPSSSGVVLLNPALRNLPSSLLEKVKAKQAAKALEKMTRSSENEQKYLIYSRLPDLAKTLRNIYVTERKNVLALNIILSKLDSSFKANVSASKLEGDIKVLAEEAPEFIKLHDIRNNTYLKLDREVDLKKIISKLETLADKYNSD